MVIDIYNCITTKQKNKNRKKEFIKFQFYIISPACNNHNHAVIVAFVQVFGCVFTNCLWCLAAPIHALYLWRI